MATNLYLVRFVRQTATGGQTIVDAAIFDDAVGGQIHFQNWRDVLGASIPVRASIQTSRPDGSPMNAVLGQNALAELANANGSKAFNTGNFAGRIASSALPAQAWAFAQQQLQAYRSNVWGSAPTLATQLGWTATGRTQAVQKLQPAVPGDLNWTPSGAIFPTDTAEQPSGQGVSGACKAPIGYLFSTGTGGQKEYRVYQGHPQDMLKDTNRAGNMVLWTYEGDLISNPLGAPVVGSSPLKPNAPGTPGPSVMTSALKSKIQAHIGGEGYCASCRRIHS